LTIRLSDHPEDLAQQVSRRLAAKRKSALGQFMTPAPVARFMVSLFPPAAMETCRLLDPGSGTGALSCAFLDRWAARDGLDFRQVEIAAHEIDDSLRTHLETTLASYAQRLPVTTKVFPGDFIWETARNNLRPSKLYSHAILNPPYKKINSDSQHRLILRRVGIETVNLYSAFVALSLTLMQPGGQLVAIIPRSFCNGPYYRPFRQFLLRHAAFHYMHLFGSRNQTFKDDDVLQENIIIRLERAARPGNVIVSTSTDHNFSDFESYEHPFERIVFPDDPG
jgi:adenine-specific DNA-methyltransferase